MGWRRSLIAFRSRFRPWGESEERESLCRLNRALRIFRALQNDKVCFKVASWKELWGFNYRLHLADPERMWQNIWHQLYRVSSFWALFRFQREILTWFLSEFCHPRWDSCILLGSKSGEKKEKLNFDIFLGQIWEHANCVLVILATVTLKDQLRTCQANDSLNECIRNYF